MGRESKTYDGLHLASVSISDARLALNLVPAVSGRFIESEATFLNT